MIQPISITAINSVSPLGNSPSAAWDSYLDDTHFLKPLEFEDGEYWGGRLDNSIREEARGLGEGERLYDALDESVKYALLAARLALKSAGWKKGDNFGVNIGSSRGATGLFEKYHKEFLEIGRSSVLTSPTTTLGNISSWVAHDLQSKGPEISHSITCSTALHSLLNGMAWIGSGMTEKFMAGGSEAPLTRFTIAQMQALKIYAPKIEGRRKEYPCRALDLKKKSNSMVLGEGASLACLEAGISSNALAVIEGIGYATEILEHNVSLSAEGKCLEKSMKMAIGSLNPAEVDAVVLHAPGTIKGDLAEYSACQAVFGKTMPALTTNKWKIGHTFGASGMLSLEMAVLMLKYGGFIKVPYLKGNSDPARLHRVLVNAVGFGGNAVSVLLKAV